MGAIRIPHGWHCRGVAWGAAAPGYLMMVPMVSPFAIRIILPVVVKLKTMMGSLLSRHIATALASITARALESTSK
jgi:hypothetical protein